MEKLDWKKSNEEGITLHAEIEGGNEIEEAWTIGIWIHHLFRV